LKIREVDPHSAEYKERIAGELEAISREHVKNTLHQREMGFFVGSFDAHTLQRQRLFIGEVAGQIDCFVMLNPCLAGTMWAFEVFRQRAGAARGIIPAAMLQIMRQLKAEGVRYASLSLVPFVRCEIVLKNDSYIARSVEVFFWRFLNPLYDVRGLYHFKSRFRPYYREMYIAAMPYAGVRTMFDIAVSWKLFHFNPLRLLAQLWRERGSKARESLAEPELRPEKVIRDLVTDAAKSPGDPSPEPPVQKAAT
jgi:phosphatidylglycerol lysyltransferase